MIWTLAPIYTPWLLRPAPRARRRPRWRFRRWLREKDPGATRDSKPATPLPLLHHQRGPVILERDRVVRRLRVRIKGLQLDAVRPYCRDVDRLTWRGVGVELDPRRTASVRLHRQGDPSLSRPEAFNLGRAAGSPPGRP